MLRGANASGFEDDRYRTPDGVQRVAPFWPIDPGTYAHGRCPANSHLVAQPALCERDCAQMRAFGFNVVRLTLSWSAPNSTPGRYDHTYLDRIDQVVGWPPAQHIYVLDMHQDNYSRFIPPHSPLEAPPVLTSTPGSGNHAAGAPPWAIVTDGEPSTSLLGIDFTNAYMESAFTSFWLNRPVAGGGLQDHYIGAIAAVAARVKKNPAVIGYEIMNEPLPGFVQEPLFSATPHLFYGRDQRCSRSPALCSLELMALRICQTPPQISRAVHDVSEPRVRAARVHPRVHRRGHRPRRRRPPLSRRLRPGLHDRGGRGAGHGSGVVHRRIRQRRDCR